MARINPKQLMVLDIGYIMDNVDPLYYTAKHVVFLAILALARMVIWTTQKKGLYDSANFSFFTIYQYQKVATIIVYDVNT